MGCWSVEYVVEGEFLMLLDCTLWNWQTRMPSLSNSNAMAMLVLRAGLKSIFIVVRSLPNADGDRINDMEVAMMVEGLKVNRNKTTWWNLSVLLSKLSCSAHS